MGCKIVATLYYDEFEFEGEKPLAAVKPNKFYFDGRPAAYVYQLDYNDIVYPPKL
jgi:hypothetical protein